MVWWQNAFVLTGLLLQLVGTCLAVSGLVQTWRAYSMDPLVPAWGRAKARLRSVAAAARARLPERWRKSPSTVALAGTATGTGSAKAAATIAWGALPADQGAAIGELDRRVRYVLDKAGQVEHESRTAIDRVRSDLGLGLDEEAAKREAADKAIATGGVKMALAGLVVIVAGIALQSGQSCGRSSVERAGRGPSVGPVSQLPCRLALAGLTRAQYLRPIAGCRLA